MKIEVSKPNIERVSIDEVYLLDNSGNRIKRICGAKREGIPEAYPCLEEAGKGTNHEGVGRCAIHDGQSIVTQNDHVNSFEKLISVDPDKDRTILEVLGLAQSLKVESLTSVDSEIQLLESLIAMTVKSLDESKLTPKKANDISNMLIKLGKLKQIKIEAAKKAQLDFAVVNKLIKGILLSIKMHVSDEAAKRIISDIITTTINPMMSSGDITYGDVKELKKLPKKSYSQLHKEVNSE